MQLSRIQEPQAGCGCGCILFHIQLGLSEPPSTSLPSWFRKTGAGKPFWRKTCAYQSPSSFQRPGPCLNCPSLHTDSGTPVSGQEGAFGGALCPISPWSPSCRRHSALGTQPHFPGGLTGQWAPSARPARPRGSIARGCCFWGGHGHSIPVPHSLTHPAVPEPAAAAEERRMYCMRRLLR